MGRSWCLVLALIGTLSILSNQTRCFAQQVILVDKEAEEKFYSLSMENNLIAPIKAVYQQKLEKINAAIDELPCGYHIAPMLPPNPSVTTSFSKAADEEFTCYRQTLLTGSQGQFCQNNVIWVETFLCFSKEHQ